MTPHVHEPPSPRALAAIRASGRRVTRQRALIWDALVRAGGRHLSARDVAAAVPELHRATVYRTLDVLVALGIVRRTELDARAVYELAAEHLHHHVVCTACGRVAHVHDGAVREALDRVEEASGYALAEAELTLPGTCPDCRRAAAERERTRAQAASSAPSTASSRRSCVSSSTSGAAPTS